MNGSTSRVRFFRLSHHLQHPSTGRAVLGLSIDECPSEKALWAAASTAAHAYASVTPSDIDEGFEVISVLSTARDTAVITVTRAVNEDEARSPLRLALTLSATGELTIRHQGLGDLGDAEDDKKDRPDIFVILTPLLAQLAGNVWCRCTAITASRQRCPLRMPLNDHQFCLSHREHHAYLHDERLEYLKAVQGEVSLRSASWDENVEVYNQLQETLALRNIISELLYPRNPDDGHWHAVKTARWHRSHAGYVMGQWLHLKREAKRAADSEKNTATRPAATPPFPHATPPSTPPTGVTTGADPAMPEDVGRRSIRSYMTELLPNACASETNPKTRFSSELVVSFADIRELERRVARNRRMLGSGPGPVSVMEFFDPLDGDRLPGNAEVYEERNWSLYHTAETPANDDGDVTPADPSSVVTPVPSPPAPAPVTGREFDKLLDARSRATRDLPPLTSFEEEKKKEPEVMEEAKPWADMGPPDLIWCLTAGSVGSASLGHV